MLDIHISQILLDPCYVNVVDISVAINITVSQQDINIDIDSHIRQISQDDRAVSVVDVTVVVHIAEQVHLNSLGRRLCRSFGGNVRCGGIGEGSNTADLLSGSYFAVEYDAGEVLISRGNSGQAVSDLCGARSGNLIVRDDQQRILLVEYEAVVNVRGGSVILDRTVGDSRNSVVAEYAIAESGMPLVTLDESLASEEYGIAFRKNDVKLTDEVQKILEEMAADGTVARISTAWFGSDITVIGN